MEETGRQEQLRAYNEYLYQTQADERSGSSSPRRESGWSRAKRLRAKSRDFGRTLLVLVALYLYHCCISNPTFHETINLHMTWVPLAMGDTIILVEIDSNDSKISMQIPKECPPMPANDSVEIQRRPELTFRCQPMPFNDSAE